MMAYPIMLYHGTNVRFTNIDLNKAKPFKDFGRGFYLTTSYKQAENWAKHKGMFNNYAYIYCYTIDSVLYKALNILELLVYDKAWVDFITESRINQKETDYDLIYDRMADNTYQGLSNALVKYKQGKVSAFDIIRDIQWKHGNADQYCFKTQKAVDCLKLVKIINVRR